MKLLFQIDLVSILLYVFGGLTALGLLIFLLSKFAFVGQKNKKLLKSLTIKYNYIRGLLLSDNMQYLRRIEAISDINLLLRPTFEDFNARFSILKDNDERKASRAIQVLNEALTDSNKEFKKVLPEQRAIILDYERKVTTLNKDLAAMIKPESEIREESVYDKEKLRIIKNLYRDKRGDLDIVAPSFDKVFNQIELLFKEYDDALNGAYYEEARAYLKKIRAFNAQVEKALEILPLLVLKTTVLIPDKIEKLKAKYHEALQNKIPLHHLRVNQELENFENYLSDIKHQLIRFETKGIETTLNLISETIDELLNNFILESEKQREFALHYDTTYLKVNDLEQLYIRLVNKMPQIKEYYIINEDYETKLADAKTFVNTMMGAKRSLDSFLHSATKQPYSVLVEKVNTLQNESAKVEVIIGDFHKYIETIRFIVEDGHAMCSVLFNRFKELEIMLRELHVESYTTNFDTDFDSGYAMISEISLLIRHRPIEVTKVEILTNELRQLATYLDDKIIEDIKYAKLAESAIVSLNVYRNEYSDLQLKLRDEEQRFLNGQFKQTYENVMEQLKKYKNRK